MLELRREANFTAEFYSGSESGPPVFPSEFIRLAITRRCSSKQLYFPRESNNNAPHLKVRGVVVRSFQNCEVCGLYLMPGNAGGALLELVEAWLVCAVPESPELPHPTKADKTATQTMILSVAEFILSNTP